MRLRSRNIPDSLLQKQDAFLRDYLSNVKILEETRPAPPRNTLRRWLNCIEEYIDRQRKTGPVPISPRDALRSWLNHMEKAFYNEIDSLNSDPGIIIGDDDEARKAWSMHKNFREWAKLMGLISPQPGSYNLETFYEMLKRIANATQNVINKYSSTEVIVTIDRVVKAVHFLYDLSVPFDENTPACEAGCQAVFAAFGFLTMSYEWAKPADNSADDLAVQHPIYKPKETFTPQTSFHTSESVGVLLRSIGNFFPEVSSAKPDESQQGITLQSEVLGAKYLREISRITINFVDDIGSHPCFNPY